MGNGRVRVSNAGMKTLVVAVSVATLRFSFAADSPPDRYVLEYPAAEAVCLPVRTYAEDVVETLYEINGGLARHMPNGGFGLPVKAQVNGKDLLHLGADVAWDRPNEPVHAIAAGVVRQAEGPGPANKPKASAKRRVPGAALEWGNLIVIEHRLPDGAFITSLYGHLGPRRLVEVGDTVTVGQQIGTVGRQGFQNGGYKPHLHFAIREGRFAEVGASYLAATSDGVVSLKVVQLGPAECVVEAAAGQRFKIGDRTFEVVEREGRRYFPTEGLKHLVRPEFALAGYGLSLDGWRDPTRFLEGAGARMPAE